MAKKYIGLKTFDREIKGIEERTDAINVIFDNKELCTFFEDCEIDEDKRNILDRTDYYVKKKQGGYKLVQNYNPLQFASDYVLSEDKSRYIKTRNSFSDGEIERHRHKRKPISIMPFSTYEEMNDEGETYFTIDPLLSYEDTYFTKHSVNVDDVKDFLRKYNISVEKNIIDYLMFLEQGMSKKYIKKLTGLSEKRQETIKKRIQDVITGTRTVEYVPEVEKICKHCGETKLLIEFAKDSRNKDKRKNICKKCDSKRHSITGKSTNIA